MQNEMNVSNLGMGYMSMRLKHIGTKGIQRSTNGVQQETGVYEICQDVSR